MVYQLAVVAARAVHVDWDATVDVDVTVADVAAVADVDAAVDAAR